MQKILVVDDDIAVTNFLMVVLMQSGEFEPVVVNDSRTVPDLLKHESFTAILLDMDMPGLSGLDICRIARERGISTPIIILSGVNDVDMAVNALKLGAFDYLMKPVADNFLLDVIHKAIEQGSLPKQAQPVPPPPQKQEDLAQMEGYEIIPPRHPGMIKLFERIAALAATDEPVLIVGERGSGKKAVARAIHDDGNRRDGPFAIVDMSIQDPSSFTVDFFGQAPDWRGETDGQPGILESAHRGTLCISNFDRLPMPVQIRLEAALEERTFYRQGSTRSQTLDIRLIALSRYDLGASEFVFRYLPGLMGRLLASFLRVPPLRERPDDIGHIAARFAASEALRTGKSLSGLTPELIDLFRFYPFPGNLQELRDIVSTSVMRTASGMIRIEALSPYVRDRMLEHRNAERFEPRPLAQIQHEYAKKTLEHFGGDRDRACAALRIGPDQLDSILWPGDGGPAPFQGP